MFALKHWLVSAALVGLAPLALAQPQEPATETPSPNATSETMTQVGQTDETTKAVRNLFSERFGNMPVEGVRYAPFGLFEVQIGGNIVYTNQEVTFVLDGHLIDAQTREDLTEIRLQELARIDFSALPLELAITQVRGDGSRKMAIFEDPNCGFCKQMRRSMEGLDDLTIHTFMLPILSQDSRDKVQNVWCADDRSATWDAWMLENKVPEQASCDAPLEKMLALARELQVQGTPATFFADGSRVSGAISKQDIEKRLQ